LIGVRFVCRIVAVYFIRRGTGAGCGKAAPCRLRQRTLLGHFRRRACTFPAAIQHFTFDLFEHKSKTAFLARTLFAFDVLGIAD
jgi:hypothetical protein